MKYNKTLHFDSILERIYFTSDTHLQHANIIEYCERPFNDVREMDHAIVSNWNSIVGKNDHIFVLGDFCFGSQQSWKYFTSALNGKKYLVIGNHDKSIAGHWERMDNIINLLVDDPEIKDGQRITLCHYPMLSWYQSHRGAWQLFGHVHGQLTNKSLADDGFDITKAVTPRQLDVGVDVHNFKPVSYEQVKTIITKQELGK